MNRKAALDCYRRLLRTHRFVFRGDDRTLRLAKLQTRKMFEDNRKIIDEEKIRQLISDGNEMADLLRRNVVQAVKIDEGRYRIQLDPTVHEMGDNDEHYMGKKRPEDMPPGYMEALAKQHPVKCGDVVGAQKVIELRRKQA